MELNKGHLLVAWVILDSCMKFDEAFERDMRVNKMEEMTIQKILLNIKLMKMPFKKFTTTDDYILSNIYSYVFFQLVHHREWLNECMAELEKRMKRERLTGVMADDEYFNFRRTNFELERLVDFVVTKNDFVTMVRKDEQTFIIV